MDLHPDNVILGARGPVGIDWRNATEGPADLDVAMTAVILAQVAVDATHPLAVPAQAMLTAFPASVGGDPMSTLELARSIRRVDPALTGLEVDLVADAAACVVATVSGLTQSRRPGRARTGTGRPLTAGVLAATVVDVDVSDREELPHASLSVPAPLRGCDG